MLTILVISYVLKATLLKLAIKLINGILNNCGYTPHHSRGVWGVFLKKGFKMLRLNDITIKNPIVKKQLCNYIAKIVKKYDVNDDDIVIVFVDNDNDFTAFEFKEKLFSFTSLDHKLIDTIKCKYAPLSISFADFKTFVRGVKYAR